MALEKEKEALRSWAEKKPCIRRVLIYGSHCKGMQHDGSDLDVAVELDPLPGDSGPFATWIGEAEKWRRELIPLVGNRLQLEWHDLHGKTPTVSGGLKECCLLVYERAT